MISPPALVSERPDAVQEEPIRVGEDALELRRDVRPTHHDALEPLERARCASAYASSIAAPPTPCLPRALTHPCRSVSRAASIQDATCGAKRRFGSSAGAAGAPDAPG